MSTTIQPLAVAFVERREAIGAREGEQLQHRLMGELDIRPPEPRCRATLAQMIRQEVLFAPECHVANRRRMNGERCDVSHGVIATLRVSRP